MIFLNEIANYSENYDIIEFESEYLVFFENNNSSL